MALNEVTRPRYTMAKQPRQLFGWPVTSGSTFRLFRLLEKTAHIKDLNRRINARYRIIEAKKRFWKVYGTDYKQ